jgi:uncharacterized membrane protein YkvA (DUF1232 family)
VESPARRIVKLPLRKKVALVRALLSDGNVPAPAKAVLAAGGIYLLSPIDLIPDFIPLAGQLDDLLVVGGVLALFVRLTPAHVLEAHLERISGGA